MATHINRKQLLHASDEDILEFFSQVIFHGVFSTEIKSIQKADYYKGHISNITLDGNPTNLCPTFLNVPKNSDDIPEGPCTFKCRINIDALRAEDHKYIVTLIGRSLRANHNEVNVVNPKDTTEQDLFDMWGLTTAGLLATITMMKKLIQMLLMTLESQTSTIFHSIQMTKRRNPLS